MPLPENNTELIPENLKPVYEKYEEWAAWYSGDSTTIATYYDQHMPDYNFWGKAFQKDKRRKMLHVPIAGDLASVSSDILFSEAPSIKFEDESKGAQDRLDEIIEADNVFGKLQEGSELSAAMSGIFLKVNWDKQLANHPILSLAQVDNAIPEFKFGYLKAVNFHKTIDTDGKKYLRHVERHEMSGGNAYILNGLYVGSRTDLGRQMDLKAHAYTANMEEEINLKFPKMACSYIPNKRPNRIFRGSPFGMSDYGGTEGLMDALDETFTSWMRDIRLAKSRVAVPETWLETDENGNLTFDADEEVFTKLDMDPLSAKEAGALTPIQFKIRTEEHSETALALIERIVTTAGYSPQSFGLNIQGRAESGTALNIRERKTVNTAAKKQNYWKSPLEDTLEMMLHIDKTMLGNSTEVKHPTVAFGDSFKPDTRYLAETVELIKRAQAASNKTLVAMLHPDWTKEQIEEEASKLDQAQGLGVEDPMQVGMS